MLQYVKKMKGVTTKATVNNLSGKGSLYGGGMVGRVGVLYNDPLNRQTDKNENITFRNFGARR